MSAETLKVRLEHIQKRSYQAPEDVWALTQQLLEPGYLGHPDPYIRDELVYPTLYTWITKALAAEQVRTVLAQLLDGEHLFFKLGQADDETVLVRSFTLLQIVAVLDRHQQHPYLTPEEVQRLVPVLLHYLNGERDLRGYDVRLGWLHAAAHGADAVGALAACHELSGAAVKELLGGLQSLAGRDGAYTDGEDERIAAAMSNALLRTELTPVERLGWLDGFQKQVQTYAELEMPAGYANFMNIKHTLRALYFSLRRAPEKVGKPLCERVEGLLLEFETL